MTTKFSRIIATTVRNLRFPLANDIHAGYRNVTPYTEMSQTKSTPLPSRCSCLYLGTLKNSK